uniref:NADH-ubiquinone oxidoreductase chain 6 n=2 Tax=Coleoptera TaxID=7041 RepID=A0A346RH85_9COLE|nr:NADH dehydrogenase subunit 6 [Coleoptera sp. 18 KM-2017]AXS66608.1 NADH dehydrogenase subunit 6 [Tenebrionoidea sp. 22 KM-2017]
MNLMNLILMNLSISMIFIFMYHPLSMGLILLSQTLMTCLIMGYFFINFWFSYIMFLILIGGMLILFLYMTSIASNEKFKWNFKILMLLMMFFLLFNTSIYYFINKSTINLSSLNFSISLTKFIHHPLMIMFIIMYLFIIMILVVKISNSKKGPLRLKN